MFSKKLMALAAASLVIATTPASAVPSAEALSPSRAVVSEDANQLGYGGNGIWVPIIGLALLAAFVLVIIDDEDDLPDSP